MTACACSVKDTGPHLIENDAGSMLCRDFLHGPWDRQAAFFMDQSHDRSVIRWDTAYHPYTWRDSSINSPTSLVCIASFLFIYVSKCRGNKSPRSNNGREPLLYPWDTRKDLHAAELKKADRGHIRCLIYGIKNGRDEACADDGLIIIFGC
jgi:hypothetical protein